jgi:hypothetical protein
MVRLFSLYFAKKVDIAVAQKHSEKTVYNGLGIPAFLCFLLWLAMAFLPLLALRSGYFTLRSEEEVSRFKNLLEQLGTFGDMYGMLNCLFSGAAFVGVLYTIILQQKQMRLQESEYVESRRLAGLQNRLTVYQGMKDYHQHVHENATNDILLKARSKGRAKAFAELTSNLLRESEAYVSGTESRTSQEQDFHDHPIRILHLANNFRTERESFVNEESEQSPIGPIKSLLLELVEEIAALTELAKDNDQVQRMLIDAGNAVNASIEPGNLIDDPETPSLMIRSFQLEQSLAAFGVAVQVALLLSPTLKDQQKSLSR